MVRWIIDNINIRDRNFLTSRGTVIGSFKAEDLKQMYHLLDPDKIYDNEFIAKFTKENELKSAPIKQWTSNPTNTRTMKRVCILLILLQVPIAISQL